MENKNLIIQEDNFDFVSFFFRLLKYWYIFVITAVLAVAGAYLYTRFTTSVYQVNATLLIKKEKASLLADNPFGDTDLFGGRSKDIINEKTIIQSYSVIRETVKQLDFSVSYYIQNRYSQNELYKSTPFIVKYDSLIPQPTGAEFELQFMSENTFKLKCEAEDVALYSFTTDENFGFVKNISLSETYRFGDSVKNTNYGFHIIKNPDFDFTHFYDDKEYKNTIYTFVFNNLNEQALAYKKGLTVEPLEKDVDVLKLSLKGNNISKITDFLNALSEVYIYRNLDKKNKTAKNTIAFIDSQLYDISDSLKFAENSLQKFKSANKVMDVSSQAENLFERLSDLQKEKAVLLSKNKYYNYLLKSINENIKYDDLLAPSTMGINDPLLNKLVDEMIALSSKKNALTANTSEKSFAIMNIEQKIQNSKKLIVANLGNIINATDISIGEIENRINVLDREAGKLPHTQQMLFGFERKFKLNDAIYTFLLQKRAESQISEAANVPDAEIIDKARVDQYEKKSLSYSIIYLIALLIGLFIPVAGIYIRDLLNDRIMEKKDIEDITSIPLIGGIIQFKKPNVKVFVDYPKSSISESLRSVYTNLQYILQGKKKNVILVTSVMPKEGKTFIALNLASVFASFNRKTCLLSFDLRLPKIQDYFDTDNSYGLSTYLIKHSTKEEIIYKSEIENLDIIFAGPIPPNPVELIASKQAEDLFDFLKSEYDTVIIDSPPLGIVADAVMLAKYSDTNIFVSRQNYSKKKALSVILSELQEEEKKKTGIIFNGIKKSRIYGYGYEYGYGYGYGYGNDYFKQEEKEGRTLNLFKKKIKKFKS